MGLFFSSVGEYKSSWYEIARNLFRSRNNQRARAELLAEEARELRLRNEQLRHKSEETKKQLEQRNSFCSNNSRQTKNSVSSPSRCQVILLCRIIPTAPK